MSDPEEAVLIRRCQDGDKEAFRTLVERYRRALFGTAYLMIRDHGRAEDAVQDALVQMWRHLPSLRLQGSLKAWLLRIVVNEVKQQFRKTRVSTVPLEQSLQPVDTAEADSEIVRREESQCLRQAVKMLPPEQREAVVLRYFSGLSVAEIAEVMDQREGTIKSRLSRALDRLNEILQDEEVGDGRR